MSLLLDALKNASARKDKAVEKSSQENPSNQNQNTSQKLTATLFNTSANKSQTKIIAPLLAAGLALVVVVGGVYWWRLPSVDAMNQPITTNIVIPDIVTTAVELDRMTTLVDQMQAEQISININAERKKKELEKLLSEKTKALTIAEQHIIALNTQAKENAELPNQLESLHQENEDIKAKQILASENIGKIQEIQNTLFRQLENDHRQAFSKIKTYDLRITDLTKARNRERDEYRVLQETLDKKTKSTSSLHPSQNSFTTKSSHPDDSISLRLDMQINVPN